MKNVNNFQTKNVQPLGVTYQLLNILPILADVAHESVDYKRKYVLQSQIYCNEVTL